MALQRIITVVLLGALVASCSSRRKAVTEETAGPAMEPTAPSAPAEAAPSPSAGIWSYEGDRAPDKWASLNPDYLQCGQGKKQSPINLTWKKPTKKGAPRMDFSYTPAPVQVDISSPVPRLRFNGGNQLLLNGKVYNLESIDFHSPSEHQLSKNSMSIEIQMIHKAVNGDAMAALSIFAIEGRENSLLNDVWTRLSAGDGPFQFDASKLLPPQKTFYHYNGSLTTPPCTEGVEWIVFNTPMEMSRDQIMAFRSKFPANGRPLQPLNGRKIMNH